MNTKTHERKRWWTPKGVLFGVGVVAWLVADGLFHYRSMVALYILMYVGFMWFVVPEFESWVKRLSTEALKEATPEKKTESQLETVSDSLTELRNKLRGLDFVPYSVSVRVDCRTSTLLELTQKLGFFDGKEWINGVKVVEAQPGRELNRGIYFQVVSSDEYGYPKLVYRIDGKTARFQNGLTELRRAIEEFSFEGVKSNLDPAAEKAFRAISGPKHPKLCFGNLLRDSSDTYQVAIEVDEDWWHSISDKPEIECELVHKGDANGPYVRVYLVLARIPRRVIHGEAQNIWKPEVVKEHEIQLEELGWTIVERGRMRHKFVDITRYDLDGKSSVGGKFE